MTYRVYLPECPLEDQEYRIELRIHVSERASSIDQTVNNDWIGRFGTISYGNMQAYLIN